MKKTRTFLQNKLWRDEVVAAIQAQGSVLEMRRLDDHEFDQKLRLKLLEECEEVQAAHTQHQLIEELADMFEVIDSLCALHGIEISTVHKAQLQKRLEKGGFDKRLFVAKATHAHDSKSVDYCLAQPHKYPEITQE
jgi:predicted house-cleaning noncanonical NTP pyrophosphatase (MazG superfamily)